MGKKISTSYVQQYSSKVSLLSQQIGKKKNRKYNKKNDKSKRR